MLPNQKGEIYQKGRTTKGKQLKQNNKTKTQNANYRIIQG